MVDPDQVSDSVSRGSLRRLSVVIANYNYAAFLREAVESALAIAWDDLEVIVVDDGSTDGSLAVLKPYRDRVRVIESENHGQREAVNLGFACSSGDAILFLDSDDVLPPEVAKAASSVLNERVSKVQFRMQRIDASGRPIGRPFPDFHRPPTPQEIQRWYMQTTAYPTPPGSGNLYARWFLDRVMPQGGEFGASADSGLLAMAPLLGDVVTVPDVIVKYRRHAGNDSSVLRRDANFHRECLRAYDRWNGALAVAGLPPAPEQIFRSREVLQFRAAAASLTPRLHIPGESRRRLFLDVVRSLAWPGADGFTKRAVILLWTLGVLAAPRSLSRKLISLRFERTQ